MEHKEKFSKGFVTGVVFCLALYSGFGAALFSFRSSQVGATSPPVASTFIIEAEVTAYCPCEKCCGEYADGITACGHRIKEGDKFCAAPPEIPFGTMIKIPGYGVVSVLDRGGKIKGNKFEVFFPTHQEALQWGVKYLIVEEKK